VNLAGILGLVFVILSGGLVVVFIFAGRDRSFRYFRTIPAYTRFRRAVGLAVEAGTRLHVALGRGGVTDNEIAPALVGLTVQERVARAASVSDRPPISTTGNGALGILSRDTFSGAYRALGAEDQYDPTRGRVVGLTPFAYAAGALSVIHDEQISANILIGHMGSEAAFLAEAAERSGSLSVMGVDNLPGQAVLFATAQEPLIGEEVFAGGAYLGAGPAHEASLRAQDLLRILIILFILVGSLMTFLGLDRQLEMIMMGLTS
jgi:hypothetical protein